MSIESGTLTRTEVRSMFDRIAPIYDGMNRVMTGGLDGRWRRLAAQAVVEPGSHVIDVCCGTGDLALAARAEGGHVVGVDFSEEMLERARRKSSGVEWVRGDLLELPFEDAKFDVVTAGFGVRHVQDVGAAFRELRRVLRRGGRLAVLDLARPRGPLALFYRVWFDRLIPLAGRFLPGGAAFTYLPASVRRFPRPIDLEEQLRLAGFDPVAHRLIAGGIVVLLVGEAA